MGEGRHPAAELSSGLDIIHGCFMGSHGIIHAAEGEVGDGFDQELVASAYQVVKGNAGLFRHQLCSVFRTEIPLDRINACPDTVGAYNMGQGSAGLGVGIGVGKGKPCTCSILEFADLAKIHDTCRDVGV